MKKALVLSFALSGILMASAQVQVGVKGGANANFLYRKTPNATSSNRGFAYGFFNPGVFGGVSVGYAAKNWTLQTEINYSDRGYVTAFSTIVNAPYIHIPLLFRRRVHSCFWVEAGPEIGLRSQTTEKFPGGGDKEPVYWTAYRRLKEIGASMGVFAMPFKSLRVGFRYYQGLSTISPTTRFPGQMDPYLGIILINSDRIYPSAAMIYTEWIFLRKRT